MYKKFFFIIIIVVSCMLFLGESLCAKTNELKDDFTSANVLYSKGEIEQAIKVYKKILDQGYVSGNIFYNLGNCYYKLDKNGYAIYYYKRALDLIPRDSDLLANYRYLTSLVTKTSSMQSTFFIVTLFDGVKNSFTINEMSILLSIFFVLILLLLILVFYFYQKKSIYVLLFILFCLFLFYSILLVSKIKSLEKRAVVISGYVDTKYEPFDRATDFFRLYEGMQVRIVEKKDNWSKVKRNDGKLAWMNNESILVY